MENIPIYDAVLTEDDGINIVSFVTKPAIGVNWVAFSEEPSRIEYIDQEQRKVFGPVLIPNQLVARKGQDGKPVFWRFGREVIEQVRDRFMMKGSGTRANEEHTPLILDKVYMVESFIKDSTRGIVPPSRFNSLPDGTWFATFKIDNDEVWETLIKSGEFTGFSVEGFIGLKDSGETAPLTSDMRFSKALLSKILQLEKYI